LTLTSILNYTSLTYENVTTINSNINSLTITLNNLKTYLEAKWGSEDADEIVDKLKDIGNDVSYLKSQYYYLSEDARQSLLLSIKSDSRAVLDLIYEKDNWYDNIYIWIIPSVFLVLLIILIIYLSKRKSKKEESFGGEING